MGEGGKGGSGGGRGGLIRVDQFCIMLQKQTQHHSQVLLHKRPNFTRWGGGVGEGVRGGVEGEGVKRRVGKGLLPPGHA